MPSRLIEDENRDSFHVSIFGKVFNFIENIVHGGEWVIVYFGHLLFEIVELAW